MAGDDAGGGSSPPPGGADWMYDTIGRGDKKTVTRAGWYSGWSNIRMLGDSQQAKDRFDDAEGWAPRISYGNVPANFASLGSNSGGASNPSITTVTSGELLRRKSYNSAASERNSGYRRVMRMKNHEGSTSNEVYTNNYSGTSAKKLCNNGGSNLVWKMSMYVREGYQGGWHRPRVTMWLFGTNISKDVFFSGHSFAAGGDYTTPSQGSGHFKQETLAASGGWTKIEMYCKFTHSSIYYLTTRIDIDDGRSGGNTEILVDRMQLVPVGIGIDKNMFHYTNSDPYNLNDELFGTYAT